MSWCINIGVQEHVQHELVNHGESIEEQAPHAGSVDSRYRGTNFSPLYIRETFVYVYVLPSLLKLASSSHVLSVITQSILFLKERVSQPVCV